MTIEVDEPVDRPVLFADRRQNGVDEAVVGFVVQERFQ